MIVGSSRGAWWWRCATLLWALVAPPAGLAQSPPSDASVKAAYLYKFLPYVEWPAIARPAPDAPFVIGVVGAPTIENELRELTAGRRVNGHPIETRTLRDGDSPDELHVLFVGQPSALPAWLERLHGKPVLVVSDAPRSLDSGSMLTLVPIDGRIRFEAAPNAAERAGLRLSARLLTVADRVVR